MSAQHRSEATKEFLLYYLAGITSGLKTIETVPDIEDGRISSFLQSDGDNLNISINYSCVNNIELLASISEMLVLHNIRVACCPLCGRVFFPTKSNTKFCSADCRKQSDKRAQMKYASRKIQKAYRNAKERIRNNSSYGNFIAESFCPEGHHYYPKVKELLETRDLYTEDISLLRILSNLKKENYNRVKDNDDPYTESDMIQWLDDIRVNKEAK